ncbi:cell division cycle-related protein [Elasticomyces elasticus]|nr:cell division cycle-related protein [Elasticomyces elasticus]KAK3621582.1 cell division cycle-related protein [Elasticomyces elasticus]KAK4903837.1 cell division cycle-related protein [Elasticomyces elasticus]KAK5734026.1 cell division cycle-related protein [Elasticomyces elasticus]
MQIAHAFAIHAVRLKTIRNAKSLVRVIEQKMRGLHVSGDWLVITSDSQAPSRIVPKNMKKLKFLHIDALELARQLTILESSLYSKIRPMECLGKTWQKVVMPSDADPAKNVKAFGLHSDRVTNWVARTILIQSNMKRRTLVIRHFVSIAENCRTLNNFFCLTSIISALGSVPVHRSSKTWSMVDARTMKTFGTMRKLIGSTKDFLEYRESLHKANPPCTPDFRIYLRDLAVIEDDLPAMIEKTQRINFVKHAKAADVIRDTQQYQNVPYSLQAVPELQEYIILNLQSAINFEKMYKWSLQVEPIESGVGKIARLLSKSGFL